MAKRLVAGVCCTAGATPETFHVQYSKAGGVRGLPSVLLDQPDFAKIILQSLWRVDVSRPSIRLGNHAVIKDQFSDLYRNGSRHQIGKRDVDGLTKYALPTGVQVEVLEIHQVFRLIAPDIPANDND